MTRYYKQADGFFPQPESLFESIHEHLPPGNYVIKQSMAGLYFSKYEKDFSITGKVYGDAGARADRIINTFLNRQGSTGVLLSGEAGTGKTMLGKLTCQKLAKEHGIPTIFVTEPWNGESFMNLIGSVNQPAVVFFDEFEKVYDGKNDERHGNHTQTTMLTLLDGVFTTQKLFILTCNDKYSVDKHMINRPGRLFYSFEYAGLPDDFIREYAADRLNNKEYVESLLKMTAMFGSFSFDMLQAIVEEMNRYGEAPAESLKYLNITPERDYNDYKVTLIPHGRKEPLQKPQPAKMQNPISRGKSSFQVYTYELAKGWDGRAGNGSNSGVVAAILNDADDDEEGHYVAFTFVAKDITKVTADGYELVNAAGDRLILKKEPYHFDWRAL